MKARGGPRPGLGGWLAARPALSWALYDWANSAFATTVMAGFFPTFFRQFWSVGAESSVTTFRLGMANALAGLAIALLAPFLGAVADRGGQRKRMLAVFSMLGILATLALYFIAQGQWLAAAVLFTLGTLLLHDASGKDPERILRTDPLRRD